MVLISGAEIAVTLPKILMLHIIFARAVDNDMYMDIAASVKPIRVGTDKSLMSGKILFAVFSPSCCACSPVSLHSSLSFGSKLMM